MTVGGVAGETDIARGGDLFLDAAEVGAEVVVADDAEFSVFESVAKFVGHIFFDLGREGDGFDPGAVVLFSALSEVHADVRGINATAFHSGPVEEAVKLELDLGEFFIAQLDAETVPDDIADFLAEVQDTEIVFAGDINTEVELALAAGRGAGAGQIEGIRGEELQRDIFAGFDHFVGEEGGGFVGRSAAVVLEPLLFVNALGAKAGEEFGAGLVSAVLLVNALDDALSDGSFERDGVEGPAHGI